MYMNVDCECECIVQSICTMPDLLLCMCNFAVDVKAAAGMYSANSTPGKKHYRFINSLLLFTVQLTGNLTNECE